MKSNALSTVIQNYLERLKRLQPRVARIINEIAEEGGRAVLVGGVVRDLIMGVASKDIDIEVYGLALAQLESILRRQGPVSLVGKSFGVLRLHGLDIDWSIPRSDSPGRKPAVTFDPTLNIERAFARRDLTINAMGIDMHNGKLIDPFGGLQDIEHKVLRSPDPTFFEQDPLRFYRMMQFISRLEFYPDQHLHTLCKSMDVSTVSRERIESEFEKMLLKSKRPSLGLRWIQTLGRMNELFPELGALVGCQQRDDYHPEGDVFEHSMQALDAAAMLAQKITDSRQKLILLYAALCHDFGKPLVTKNIKGVWRSINHDAQGVIPTKSFLRRLMRNAEIIEPVVLLVRYHMQPLQFISNKAKASAYKRLALKLAPSTSLAMLALLALADKRGRNPKSHDPLASCPDDKIIKEFVAKAQKAYVEYRPEEPLLQGRDLMGMVQPGPEMGKVLRAAYEIQLDEGITDKEELKRRVFEKNNA